jgi:creatinine amidohydrolase
MPDPVIVDEVRLDRLRPDAVAAAMARAPVAWLPLGAVEYHAPHLPLGTDSLTAVDVVERAAREVGGVVLPPVVTTLGTLHLPWSLRFDAGLVEATLRSTIDQLAAAGARVVVVHTGHAPLDLLHRIKRVCREAEAARRASDDAFRVYGLC